MSAAGLPASLATVPEADQFEIVAAMVVEALASDIEINRLDHGGGGTQLADFRFEGADGADLGRLEITTTTRQNRSSFMREVSRRSWRFPLSWSWTVRARDTARISELHRKIAPLLAQLERDGRTDGWIPDRPALDPADPGALPPGLARLGVLAACAAHHHAAGETALVSVHPDISAGVLAQRCGLGSTG
jgi:hypothetical protein